MLLSILIPTYNRANDLIKNIDLLERYIIKNKLLSSVEIIISNNNSNDNTENLLKKYKDRTNDDVIIRCYHQKQNLGLEGNTLFVLDKSKAKYVMYTGDDDYIDEKYLVGICDKLSYNDNDIALIVGAILAVDTKGNNKGLIKHTNIPSQLYKKGFKNCLINNFRAHQMSGITFLREGTLKAYKEKKITGLYPFIFFSTFNALRGETWNYTDYPTSVTVVPQSQKEWTFNEDGLVSDIFIVYKNLDFRILQRFLLEMRILTIHKFRYMQYFDEGYDKFIKSLLNIQFGKNTSILTSILFPFIYSYYTLKLICKKIKNRIVRLFN